MQKLLYIALFLVLSQPVWAQTEGDATAEETKMDFVQQVREDLLSIKTDHADATALFFQNSWDGGKFSSGSKMKVQELYHQFKEKNYNASQYRLPFIAAITGAAQNLAQADAAINTYLTVLERAITELPANEFRKILVSADLVLREKALYQTKQYELAFSGGGVSFEWKEPEPIVQEPVETEESSSEDGWGSQSDDGWGSTEQDDAWGSDSSSDGWGDNNTDTWGTETEKNTTPAPSNQGLGLFQPTPMPALNGPVVKLRNINLHLNSVFDSVEVSNTTATLDLTSKTLVAESGIFTWEHLGIGRDSLSVELENYTMEVNKPVLLAENATLTYPSKVNKPVKGLLEYRVEKRSKTKQPEYPVFQSYKSGYKLNIVNQNGLTVTGGVTLKGKTLSTGSLDNGFSQMDLQGQAVKKFRAQSREFTYEDSTFRSDLTSLSIYQRKDSIYHPGVSLRYTPGSGNVVALKGEGGFKKSPFFSSYFNIDFNADKIEWDTDSSAVEISILLAGNRVPAVFESSEYFNEYRYNSLSGMYNFHPLQLIVGYAKKANTDDFYVTDVSERLGVDISKLRSAMTLLMENGFVIYDAVSGYIKILDKAYHYVDSRWGRKDFDNVQITSISPGEPNGVLNLDDGSLTIRGVEEFNVNDKLGVKVKPDSGVVVLKKDRDIKFNGTVLAGNYEYVGRGFEMDYDSFKIDLPEIDKIKFNLDDAKNSSNPQADQIQNQLVETAGVLYINKPDNKSAVKEYPGYPIFNATKGATVYFLGEEILDGVYDKSLYFVIPPFTIDSVSSSDPNSIAFDGIFHSGDIFPEFEEKLRVMPDKSLGFNHPLPPEGIDLLGGDATFYGSIKLDNKGLRGGDKIEYLTSTINSTNFTFFKDSIVGEGTYAYVDPGELDGASFPPLEVSNFNMRWLTAKDSLYLENQADPFNMYDETATLEGKAIVSSKGLFGQGELRTRGSVTKSDQYKFEEYNYGARNANFIIQSSDSVPALASEDVRVAFDLTNNKATINPEIEGEAALNFPYANYRTSIPTAEWDLEDRRVVMKKPDNININNSYFYSTNPDQDSLVFNATEAVYNIDKLELNVSGIPFIKVADAKITPENNEVLILENAQLGELNNARIVVDTLTEYHNLFDGQVKIVSRNKFEGSATYRYVNSVGDTFNIKMGAFELLPIPDVSSDQQKKLRTVSSGQVAVEDRFIISPGMFYKGDVTMYADKPALQLEGYVQLDLEDIPNYDTWIKYSSDGSAKEVVFDFDNSVTELGEKPQAGIHFESQTNDLYATFITPKRNLEDPDFFTPSGQLSYKAASNEFVIEDLDKSIGNSYSGKYFAYNEEAQTVKFEGPLKFLNSRKEAAFNAAGSGLGNLAEQEFSFNIMLTTEFDVPTALTQIAGNDMVEVVSRLGIPEATKDLDRLLPKLAEISGNQVAKRYEEEIFNDYIPLHTMHGSLTKTLNFTNIDLKWSSENNSWYSMGKIGLSNTGAIDINANLDGFIEIKKGLEGEFIKMFIQVSPTCWYYFFYENDRLIFYSSNREANGLIDKKSKATKAKIGEFVFLTGDIQEVTTFVEEFRRKYYDIDAPYYLEMAPEAGEFSQSAPPTNTPLPTQQEPTTPVNTDDDDDGF